MKTSDFDDKIILEFLAKYQGTWSTHGKGYSMPTVNDAFPPGTPEKIILSKMKALIKKGYSGGCDCGCRGDYEITDKGLEFIGQQRTKPYNGY